MSDGFPQEIKDFIAQNIHSVAQLEVLLMLRSEPERRWNLDETARHLYLQPAMVDELLNDLVRRGFVARSDTGFQYLPRSETIGQSIDRLAHLYHERRVAVTAEIFSKPVDFVKAFADAFRLRGKE